MAPNPVAETATAKGNKVRSFSLEEINSHKTSEDCWLLIRNKVYDVTSFIPNHPGGELILLQPGGEVTSLFESSHPLAVRNILSKYQIGVLNESDKNKVVRYDEKESEFYLTLKKRVEEYFRVNKLNPRDVPQMYMRTSMFLLATVVFYYLAFFAFDSLLLSWLSALCLGACWTLVAMCITHDGNHGAYSNRPLISKAMGCCMDFIVGASSYVWQQQHDYGHHSFTNVDSLDPDIRVNDPDIRRCTASQPWRAYHRFQHVYLAMLYGLLGLKAVFVDDFSILSQRRVGNILINRFTKQQLALFVSGKLFYFSYALLLPLSYLPVGRFLFLYISAMCITGWYLAFMFEVAHVIGQAEWPLIDKNGAVSECSTRDWAAMQVRTTANFCATSKFWNIFSGGLCNQVEHHLFPTICHVHFTALAPIVKRTCKEFGQPYLEFPTFREALMAHFAHLKKVGAGEFHLKLA